METRLFHELGQREEPRKKHARIAKRMELEAMWLARRKEEEMKLSILRMETAVENIHLQGHKNIGTTAPVVLRKV